MAIVILFNKPFRVLSQFSESGDKSTLADFINIPNVYPAGRLDYDSEGLMILTDDGKLQARIANPDHKQAKCYLAQVENIPNQKVLLSLSKGIKLKDGMTRPANANLIEQPNWLWSRNPPIRQRMEIPTQWIQLEIKEGKNRQVRRMTAAVGHPTLRLIRTQVSGWSLDGLLPGQYRQFSI
jgi:23S rRNA pseudouridine2457 synthase|tara:strand:- start:95 stop:637 length:543 start_codon:yes stop_codon:yes gene_type:complete